MMAAFKGGALGAADVTFDMQHYVAD